MFWLFSHDVQVASSLPASVIKTALHDLFLLKKGAWRRNDPTFKTKPGTSIHPKCVDGSLNSKLPTIWRVEKQ